MRSWKNLRQAQSQKIRKSKSLGARKPKSQTDLDKIVRGRRTL